jgi:dTDP-4-dehydrorhamnose reductase
MKCLILGDGKLAAELCKQTGWDYASRKKNGWDFITQQHEYIQYIIDNDYDVIINCIANTKTTDNTKNAHWEINFGSVIGLTNFCFRWDKKLVHISSDYLYANSNSNASEEDVPVHENNWYCYTKLLADGYIQGSPLEKYLIIRTSFKLKPYPWPEAWTDITTNADYVDIISEKIIKLIEHDAVGVYNVGTQTKSFYDLALQTRPNVQPITDDGSFNRPHDVTMDLTKLNAKIT